MADTVVLSVITSVLPFRHAIALTDGHFQLPRQRVMSDVVDETEERNQEARLSPVEDRDQPSLSCAEQPATD